MDEETAADSRSLLSLLPASSRSLARSLAAAQHQAATIRSTFALEDAADDSVHSSHTGAHVKSSPRCQTRAAGRFSEVWTHMKQNDQQRTSAARPCTPVHARTCLDMPMHARARLHHSRLWADPLQGPSEARRGTRPCSPIQFPLRDGGVDGAPLWTPQRLVQPAAKTVLPETGAGPGASEACSLQVDFDWSGFFWSGFSSGPQSWSSSQRNQKETSR